MMRGGQTSTQTVQVASNVDRSGAVLLLGGGLVLVNFLGSSGSLMAYIAGHASSPPPKGTIPWGTYALALFGIFLLLLLAKTGEAGGNFAVILLAAAWVVWLLNSGPVISTFLGLGSSSSNKGTSSPSTGSKKA